MGSGNFLFLSFLFGTIGVAYLMYAKKQQKWMAFLSGLGLCAFTYFFTNMVFIIVVGIMLMILPFVIRI